MAINPEDLEKIIKRIERKEEPLVEELIELLNLKMKKSYENKLKLSRVTLCADSSYFEVEVPLEYGSDVVEKALQEYREKGWTAGYKDGTISFSSEEIKKLEKKNQFSRPSRLQRALEDKKLELFNWM
ncbi:MAG: hypothetical protein GOU97_03960 [Nanoarchaeota archaeon]|nr:hypothetical protein [Nanoarchaeota archaeon]